MTEDAHAAVADGMESDAPTLAENPRSAEGDAAELVVDARAQRPILSAVKAVFALVRTIVTALLLSFAIRVIVVEPFHIPSESMEPTLYEGDYIGAVKFPYGWSRVSTSPIALPMIPGRLFGREASRGDMIVFRNRLYGGEDWVKRVIGLPGDTVQMSGGQLYLNGEQVPREHVGYYDGVDHQGEPARINVYEEQISETCSYRIQTFQYDTVRPMDGRDTEVFTVPDGHYFVMGDNRDASRDSRQPLAVGFVPEAEVIGRAQLVFMSMAEGFRFEDPSTWPLLRDDRTLKPLTCR
jgi:signal peptidase I